MNKKYRNSTILQFLLFCIIAYLDSVLERRKRKSHYTYICIYKKYILEVQADLRVQELLLIYLMHILGMTNSICLQIYRILTH